MLSKHPFLMLVFGGVLLIGSILLASIPWLPAAVAIALWAAGSLLGVGLSVWAFLAWSRGYTGTSAVWLIFGSLGLFAFAVVAHNVFYGLTGIEEPVFFALALWIAPCMLIASIIRLARPNHYGGGPTGQVLSH